MTKSYNTNYQAHRMAMLHRLNNLDPDELVDELNLETDDIIKRFKDHIEQYIEENYEEADDENY